jgi:hypothetical protein
MYHQQHRTLSPSLVIRSLDNIELNHRKYHYKISPKAEYIIIGNPAERYGHQSIAMHHTSF